MYFALTASSFSLALSEMSNAATVKAWSMLPEAKSLPGITTTSAFFVCLFSLLRLTATR